MNLTTLFFVFGAALNVAAVVLMWRALRAPLERLARLEKLALLCAAAAVLSLLAMLASGWGHLLLDAATAYYAGSHFSLTLRPLSRLLLVRTAFLHAALLPLPLAVWLGIFTIRNQREQSEG